MEKGKKVTVVSPTHSDSSDEFEEAIPGDDQVTLGRRLRSGRTWDREEVSTQEIADGAAAALQAQAVAREAARAALAADRRMVLPLPVRTTTTGTARAAVDGVYAFSAAQEAYILQEEDREERDLQAGRSARRAALAARDRRDQLPQMHSMPMHSVSARQGPQGGSTSWSALNQSASALAVREVAPSAPSRMAVAAVEAAVRAVGGPIQLADRAALAHFGRIYRAAFTAGFSDLAIAQACSVWASEDLIEAANAELGAGEPPTLAPFHRILTRSARSTAHIARAEALRFRQGDLDIRIYASRLSTVIEHVNMVADLPGAMINPIPALEARRTFMDGIADPRARTYLGTAPLSPYLPLKDLAEAAYAFIADTAPPAFVDDAAMSAKVRSLEGEVRALRLKLKDSGHPPNPSGEYAARASGPQALPVAASTGGWEARTCFNCGKQGHPAHECKAPRDEARVSRAFQAHRGGA
ncbi:MAG: zinc finger CCHC domain-containing protein, partial [Gemmataceae bacterium]